MKQTLPKIEFRYSWIYDENLKEWTRASKERKMFTSQKILNYIRSIEPLWRKHEKKILKEISKASGLSWSVQSIPCYIVAWSIPFSDPLTVPVYQDKERFVDTLTHELIHQIFFQGTNMKRMGNIFTLMHKKYKKEPLNTRIHIPVHAVHEHVLRTLFGEKRLEKEYQWMKRHKEYKRSWDIVKKVGYQSILKTMRGKRS